MPNSDKAISADSAEIRKRGRPARYPKEQLALMRGIVGEPGSDRFIIDKYRSFFVAIRLWKLHDPECQWLFPGPADASDWRWAIFTELGKIDDFDDQVALAKEICKAEPSAKAAIYWIRQLRGKHPAKCDPRKRADSWSLASALSHCLDDYLAHHDDCSDELLATAIDQFNAAFHRWLTMRTESQT